MNELTYLDELSEMEARIQHLLEELDPLLECEDLGVACITVEGLFEDESGEYVAVPLGEALEALQEEFFSYREALFSCEGRCSEVYANVLEKRALWIYEALEEVSRLKGMDRSFVLKGAAFEVFKLQP